MESQVWKPEASLVAYNESLISCGGKAEKAKDQAKED